jgi:hypothetical protein
VVLRHEVAIGVDGQTGLAHNAVVTTNTHGPCCTTTRKCRWRLGVRQPEGNTAQRRRPKTSPTNITAERKLLMSPCAPKTVKSHATVLRLWSGQSPVGLWQGTLPISDTGINHENIDVNYNNPKNSAYIAAQTRTDKEREIGSSTPQQLDMFSQARFFVPSFWTCAQRAWKK